MSRRCPSLSSIGATAAFKFACQNRPDLPVPVQLLSTQCLTTFGTHLFAQLENRTTWFVGDSIMFQTFFEAVCRLELESNRTAMWTLLAMTGKEERNFVEARAGRLPMCATITGVEGARMPHTVKLNRLVALRSRASKTAHFGSITTICYLQERHDVAASLEQRILEDSFVQSGDVAILNAGAHFQSANPNDVSSAHAGAMALKRLARRMREGNLTSQGKPLQLDLIWRESSAMHFPIPADMNATLSAWRHSNKTLEKAKKSQFHYMVKNYISSFTYDVPTDGTFDERLREYYAQAESKCEVAVGATAKPAVTRLMEALLRPDRSITYLPTWLSTRDSPDAHPGYPPRSPPNSDTLDCAHSCLFSGVDKAVLDAISVELQMQPRIVTGVQERPAYCGRAQV